jgi:hypothetical protein
MDNLQKEHNRLIPRNLQDLFKLQKKHSRPSLHSLLKELIPVNLQDPHNPLSVHNLLVRQGPHLKKTMQELKNQFNLPVKKELSEQRQVGLKKILLLQDLLIRSKEEKRV